MRRRGRGFSPGIGRKECAAPAPLGYELTLSNPTVTQTIVPELPAARGQTFAEMEVIQLENRKRVPLALTVHAETSQRGQVYLGNFPLGSDRPSKFLVATQGTLQFGGKLNVTLVPLASISRDEGIRVWLKRFTLSGR